MTWYCYLHDLQTKEVEKSIIDQSFRLSPHCLSVDGGEMAIWGWVNVGRRIWALNGELPSSESSPPPPPPTPCLGSCQPTSTPTLSLPCPPPAAIPPSILPNLACPLSKSKSRAVRHAEYKITPMIPLQNVCSASTILCFLRTIPLWIVALIGLALVPLRTAIISRHRRASSSSSAQPPTPLPPPQDKIGTSTAARHDARGG